MIAIVNVGGGDPHDLMGVRNYEVRINREVLATFTHKRGDGLATCLKKAARAIEVAGEKRVDAFLDMYGRSD